MINNNLITLLTIIAINSGVIIGDEFNKKELKRKVLENNNRAMNVYKFKNNQKLRKSHIVYRTLM